MHIVPGRILETVGSDKGLLNYTAGHLVNIYVNIEDNTHNCVHTFTDPQLLPQTVLFLGVLDFSPFKTFKFSVLIE